MNSYRLLADVIVVVHFAFVAFVVFALLAILVGAVLRWGWVRNFWFRVIHFLSIALVVVQAVYGIECPLTTCERGFRMAAGETPREGAFIARWAHDLLFYDGEPWVFTTCYCVFGGVVLLTLLLAPPRWPWKKGPPSPDNP
ncbi:MAG: DUF2784 domain-containing protein [Candidatus Nealsonbacteria bacterium]|nr:DUF2784 domain-containing protein [Candidatus Nealsonbacteria bacterium]